MSGGVHQTDFATTSGGGMIGGGQGARGDADASANVRLTTGMSLTGAATVDRCRGRTEKESGLMRGMEAGTKGRGVTGATRG